MLKKTVDSFRTRCTSKENDEKTVY